MQSKDNALNQTEFNELLGACENAREKILVVLMGGLGMRVSEVSHMRTHWIDWQEYRIHIPLEEDDWKPKSVNSSRVIPFKNMERAKTIIQHYFALHDSIKGTHMTLYLQIKRIAQKANIQKKVTPHTLRATAGYMFAEAGLSAQALRQVMGWAKLETAERYISRSGRASERELEENKNKLWI
ncbi:MAG: tyrosine-type recombinase/integrase [Clostridia bacterium]|jgi:integrase/recombinase XerD|nr:tyrosine-type recombinase/integrase [Clostridia bacterium]